MMKRQRLNDTGKSMDMKSKGTNNDYAIPISDTNGDDRESLHDDSSSCGSSVDHDTRDRYALDVYDDDDFGPIPTFDKKVRGANKPVCKGIYTHHEWMEMDIGSVQEMIKRCKENHADVKSDDPNALPNDKSLIIANVSGRRCLWCTICKSHVNANKVVTKRHLTSTVNGRGHIWKRDRIERDSLN